MTLAVQHQQLSLLFPRIAALKDASPFILILESIQQSSWYLIHEIIHRLPENSNKILLRFEHLDSSKFDHVIECTDKKLNVIITELKAKLSDDKIKNVIFVDSWNHIPVSSLRETLLSLIMPNVTIIGNYNTSVTAVDQNQNTYYPSSMTLLSFFATSKLTVHPRQSDTIREMETRSIEASQFIMPLGCNKPQFIVDLEHRKRSGRAMEASYYIDYSCHKIEYLKAESEKNDSNETQNDHNLLQGLTTFNLNTTEKQKKAKDEVSLPFLQAQELGNGGGSGGAIVYEFEKDDDYDEEDPYEDPF